MIWKYIMGGVLIAVLSLGAALFRESRLRAQIEKENVWLNTQLVSCDLRLRHILEDKKSDATVDEIPDDELPNVPDRWLLP